MWPFFCICVNFCRCSLLIFQDIMTKLGCVCFAINLSVFNGVFVWLCSRLDNMVILINRLCLFADSPVTDATSAKSAEVIKTETKGIVLINDSCSNFN